MPEVKVSVATTNALLNVNETVAEIILGTSGPQGASGINAADISAISPATWDNQTFEIGIDQNAFDYIGNLDYAQFDTTTTATGAVGKLLWNDVDGTLEFQLKGGNVTLQVGQEEVVRVRNNTGSPLLNGEAVYITSANSGHINVTKASNNTEGSSSKTLGVLTEDIANGASGYCTIQGLVRNLNTSALTEGATIWLGTNGQLTTTRPTAPANSVVIGVCVVQSQGNATNGVIFVRVINGFELEELHNVLITSLANNQGLVYESATQLWKNKQIDYSWLANIPSTFTPSAHATSHGSAGSDPVTINKTQVTGTAVVVGDLSTATVGTAGYATTSGTATYSTTSGTATYATTSGTAAYGTNAGTATYATTSGTSNYATTAGTATYSTNSGTAIYATTSGTAGYSTTSGTATYATLSGQISGTAILIAEKGAINGVATLDSSGLVPNNQIPPLAITDTFVVASEAAQLALTAQVGDVAIRTDINKTFILQTSPASTLGNWKEILTPAGGVSSVIASAPLTGGTITSTGTIGLDQTALSITAGQVSGTAVIKSDNLFNLNGTAVAFGGSVTVASAGGTADYATLAGTAVYSSNSGTANYSTTSGTADYATLSETATYATTAGTSVYATTSGTSVFSSTSGTATYATNAGNASYGTTSGTAVYATTSGTAVYATDAGTAVYATTSGTAAYATLAGTAVYSSNSGTANYSTTSGTATYATNAGTAVYATTAGTATPSSHASTHGSAGSDAITINKTQVTGTAVTLADTATVSNSMLVNSSITLNGSAVALGGSATISGGSGVVLKQIDLYGSASTSGTFTWTKPTSFTPVYLDVYVVGAGGGGGGGAGGVVTSAQGGGGGGGGQTAYRRILADQLGSTVSVVVGVGGTAGTGGARTGAGGNAVTTGGNGGNGGDSNFGVVKAKGGLLGAGGASANNAVSAGGLGGADGIALGYSVSLAFENNDGGSSSATDNNPVAIDTVSTNDFVPTGGGWGASQNSTAATTTYNGQAGANAATGWSSVTGGTAGVAATVTGGNGGNGSTYAVTINYQDNVAGTAGTFIGSGGGGGASAYAATGTATGGNGGNGLAGAGGGGGGSARNALNTSPNAANGGNGGTGGNGRVLIYTYGY